MLADTFSELASIGSFGPDVHRSGTFWSELLDFIARVLPLWRDFPHRDHSSVLETTLTSDLCSYLGTVARKSAAWSNLQFNVEKHDSANPSRSIDLVVQPCGPVIWVDSRKHTIFDTLLPIECKRLPTPRGPKRDPREYVISKHTSTGGIQRFKAGNHAANHGLAAMIGYVQAGSIAHWDAQIAAWINDLTTRLAPGWTAADDLSVEKDYPGIGLSIRSSTHTREKGLQDIELHHFWILMNGFVPSV